MINYIKNFIKVLIWPIIFIIGQFLIIFIYSLPFRIKNIKSPNFNIELNNFINNNSLIISIITFIIFFFIFRKVYKKYKVDYLNNISLKLKINMFLIGASINLIYNIVIFYFNQIFNFTNMFESKNNLLLTSIIATGLLGPVLEEYLFRGIVFNRLKKFLSVGVSTFISVFVFAVFHNNLINAIFAMLIGFVLVKNYLRYKNISVPLYIHIGSNLSSVLFYNILIKDNIVINMMTLILSLVVLVTYIKNVKLKNKINYNLHKSL